MAQAGRGARVELDTIVAQATPPGVGAVAMVRMSGTRARKIAETLGGGRLPDEERVSRLTVLRRPDSGEALDHALVTWFRGPRSYTGEDVVELSVHGSAMIAASVVEACVALGARRAAPGEFTQRGYLNGKLDLTQAEAVADLVSASSPKGRDVAIHQLEKGLGARIARLREQVIGLAATLVQHIDFPEEDDAPVPASEIAQGGRRLAGEIERLLGTAPAGEMLREGAVAVLAGRPNSGKSSLFNALVGSERAIVTEEAGTTRDAIEAVVSVGGFPFRLVDTAGLRTAATRIERLGIEIARRYLEGADVVLYCSEAGDGNRTNGGIVEGDRDEGSAAAPAGRGPGRAREAFLASVSCPVVRVRTKVDLEAGVAVGRGPGLDGERADGEIPVSVVTGEGLGALRKALRQLVFGGVVEGREDVPVVTRRRQAELLRVAGREVRDFSQAIDAGIPAEFASAHLKAAETALEDILGVVATDDVLDRVFQDFCIGK